MDEIHAQTEAEPGTSQRGMDADDRIAARLKQLLKTPGISDKERKQVERNLRRLLESLEQRKKDPKASQG